MVTGTKTYQPNKGGRPKKAVKQNQLLAMRCTLIEKKVIQHKAKESGRTVSEYLRELALNETLKANKKPALPKEVLLFTGTLNHMAANLNQVAYHRNRGDDLSVLQRLELFALVSEIKALAQGLKTFLQ